MPPEEYLDLKALSSEEHVAFYGALFAMAAVDGQMAREELELIYEIVDTEGLPEAVGRRLYAYAIEPPTLGHCLWTVRDAPEAVRHGLMLNLVEVAVSDYLLSEAER